ncbi:MAG: hypothetical protein BGP13_06955 [Sphingobacteriales bacterium 40-81]|nr:MAG: hypothetical protein BGP13_06955 [Sphingobacteriales bacterium 40-81]
MFTASRCKKDVLPPETQEGKNTFGCYVNGELFVPGGGGLGPIKTCYYQLIYPSESGYVFHVSASDKRGNISKNIAINIDSIKISEGLVIQLKHVTRGVVGGGQYSGEQGADGIHRFYTTDEAVGQIVINKFDEANHIAAGTFWFTAVNSQGETVKITDGRFDMEFTR